MFNKIYGEVKIMEKRIYKKEFIELIIECTEKRIARGDVAPEEAIKDAQYFIDSYNRYPYAY